MSDPAFQVPVAFDYVATFTWAVSGAIVAIRQRFDIVGVFIVALLSAIGGGLLRDAVFLNRPPAFLVNPAYLSLVTGATVLTAFFSRFLKNLIGPETVRKIVDVIDALGTPAFAVYGMQLAEQAGIPLVGVVFVGVANGVAGGMLRDIVVREVPSIMRPGQFVSLTLFAACGLYLLLVLQQNVEITMAAWITVGAYFVVRLLTIHFNWQTKSVWEDESSGSGDRG
jgi:uncharacterized membrane protein YeiH